MTTEDKSEPLPAAVTALQRLADAFAVRREQLARSAGLSEAQWRVLEEIAAEGFMPSLFARRRARSPAAVSKLIRQLLDQGLIEVGIADVDGRQRRYRLSAAGRSAMRAVRRSRERALARIWSNLEPGALGRFAAFASDLASRLEAYAAAEDRAQKRKARRSGPASKTRRKI
jgi:DNA-binding MarR family transcriptional regulator